MKVAEWMVPDPITVSKDSDVQRAIELMRQHSIRHLPVVENSRLIGLVTQADLRQLILPSMIEPIIIKEIMITDPITISPETHIDDAARLIFEHKIGGLPVVEADCLVGIITVTDILKAFIEIMGVLKASSRLDVVLGERPEAFEEVSRIIKKGGGEIISVAVQGSRSGEKVHFFRLERCDLGPIAQALRKSGYKVTAMD